MFDTALVINDLHFNWQNDRAIKFALKAGYLVGVNWIFVNGDLVDCYQISRFTKLPRFDKQSKTYDEILFARTFLYDLRKKFPNAKIVYVFGNHEFRWEVNLANKAPELYGLEGLSLEEQLHCKKLNIEVVNTGRKENAYKWGNILIGHFDKVNMHSAYTAKSLLDRYSTSIIQAHTHRGGVSYRRLYERDIVAYENFCLCDRNPAYSDNPNWQLGFCLISKDRDSNYFFVEPCPIIEEKTEFGFNYKTTVRGVHLKV